LYKHIQRAEGSGRLVCARGASGAMGARVTLLHYSDEYFCRYSMAVGLYIFSYSYSDLIQNYQYQVNQYCIAVALVCAGLLVALVLVPGI
jgi:hypothetical protein